MVTEFLYYAKAVVLPCNEHYNLQLIYYNKFQTKSKHFTVLSLLSSQTWCSCGPLHLSLALKVCTPA